MSILFSFLFVFNVHVYGEMKPFWSPIFHCISTPGSEVEFNGLDLEDIQSVIVESNADHLLILGTFGDDNIRLEFTNGGRNILSKTLLKGKAISTAYWDENDWKTNKKNEYRYITEKYEECPSNSYIPNVWFEACGNPDGLHIIRNDSDSICSFMQSMSDSIASAITIFVDSGHSFPQIENTPEVTVFDNLDEMQEIADDLFPNVTFITTDEYRKQIRIHKNKNNNKSICLIDSRTDDEYAIGWIKNAVHIPMDAIDEGNITQSDVEDIIYTECGQLQDFNEATYIVYCTIGVRAARMATFLMDDVGINPSNVFVIGKAIALWANERRLMINDEGPTTFVHTFNNDVGNMYVLPKYRYCC